MTTRRERVLLELQDEFTTGMARAAASAALLNRELNSLSKDSVRTQRSFSDIDRSAASFGRDAEKSGSQIDRLSGRLRVLTDVATILGPAFLPVGALAVPAVAGLASELGFAALAGGTAVLAFQGINVALKAMNKAALNPTRENLDAANLALQKLSPSARKFTEEIRSLIPEAQHLRDLAATGLFPGVVDGLKDLATASTQVEAVVSAVSTELGHIAADTGKSLASDRWAPFLAFLAQEAPLALAGMATAAGNTAHAVAELWMAAEPLNKDFSAWLINATADLDQWAAGLSKTQGFNEFVAFVEEHGPQVADTFAAIGKAVIQVVEAAAPLSGPVLQGIDALANALAKLADSDIGTPLFTAAAALALFNRTMAISTGARNGLQGFQSRLESAGNKTKAFGANIRQTRADLAIMGSTAATAGARTERELLRMNSASARLKANLTPIGRGAAGFGGIAIAATGAADSIGLTNTASLALLGTMIEPGLGTAIGAVAGFMLDATSGTDSFTEAMKNADKAIASNDTGKLAADLDSLRQKQEAMKNTIGIPARGLTGYQEQLGAVAAKADEVQDKLNLQRTADQTRASLDFISQGFEATSTGLDTATQSAEDFKKSLDKINEAMSGRSTFRGYEQSLIDFADRAKKRADIQAKIVQAEADLAAAKANDPALQHRIDEAKTRVSDAKTPADRKNAQGDLNALLAQTSANQSDAVKRAQENIQSLREELAKYKNTLDTTTQAGIDTQASIDAIATSAINYAKSIQDPALRSAFLDNARDQYIKATLDAGATKKAAADLATQIGLLNGVKGKVIITVDANGVVHIISELERSLIRMQRRLNAVTAKNIRAQGGRDGDPNTLFASGGWTGPGSKYQPAGVVHADEFVFTKEATNGNVALLNALHRQLRGYADGGLVRRASTMTSMPTISVTAGGTVRFSDSEIDRIAGALLAARPLHGPVHISGDPTVYRREMQADRRRSSSDGYRRVS